MKRNRSYNGREDNTEHEAWSLFWDYHYPRMLRKHLNAQSGKNLRLPGMPKNSFELATYKICELKFNTERFENNKSKEMVIEFIDLPLEEKLKMKLECERNTSPEGKNCPRNDETVEVGSK